MKGTPEIYKTHLTVKEEHLDELKHVNNVNYVQWIQDIAKEHWLKRSTAEMQENYYWVVIRHEIDYKQQALLGDKLLLQTFVGEQTHVTSQRHVNILNDTTGDLLAHAKSTWVLMDLQTKKPVKISEEMRQVFRQ